MILSRFGIQLKRIEHSDIELIRTWRNHPSIRKTMAYRKTISAAMQEKWFSSINNKLNYYFLIIHNGKKIGVINVKNINEKNRYGEGGIFIWDESYYGTNIPSIASLLLIDFIFNTINYSTKSFVRILATNKPAINFNLQLGYVIVPYQEKESNQLYVLTREDFNKKIIKLIPTLEKLHGNAELVVEGRSSTLHLDEINSYLNQLNSPA